MTNLAVIPLRAKPLTSAERSRRYRLRRKTVTDVAPVTVDKPVPGVTISTVDIVALALRLETGRATAEDLKLCERLLWALLSMLPPDGSIGLPDRG